MAKIIRPIRFDDERKRKRRTRDRAARKRREEKMFGLQRALQRMVEPPTDLDIVVFGYHANDNRRAPR